MIYITFERGGPKFSNTTARALAYRAAVQQRQLRAKWLLCSTRFFVFVRSLKLSRRLLCSVRFVFVSTFNVQRGRSFVVGITNLSKQAVCVHLFESRCTFCFDQKDECAKLEKQILHFCILLPSAFHKSIYIYFIFKSSSFKNFLFALKITSFNRKVKVKLNYESINFKQFVLLFRQINSNQQVIHIQSFLSMTVEKLRSLGTSKRVVQSILLPFSTLIAFIYLSSVIQPQQRQCFTVNNCPTGCDYVQFIIFL